MLGQRELRTGVAEVAGEVARADRQAGERGSPEERSRRRLGSGGGGRGRGGAVEEEVRAKHEESCSVEWRQGDDGAADDKAEYLGVVVCS